VRVPMASDEVDRWSRDPLAIRNRSSIIGVCLSGRLVVHVPAHANVRRVKQDVRDVARSRRATLLSLLSKS
jgi:hypothetical protein